jgi:hypothetical protein
MAIEIGSGISIGGGISFGAESGGGGGGVNIGSITVASRPLTAGGVVHTVQYGWEIWIVRLAQ